MAQPRQYQIDRLRESINKAFANSETILEDNKRSEELEFLRTKRDEIAERMGAEALKKKYSEEEKVAALMAVRAFLKDKQLLRTPNK